MTVDEQHVKARRWRAVIQFPLVRLILAGAIVVGAFAAAQWLASQLPLDRPAKSLFATFAGATAVFAAYFGYVRLIERRAVREFSRQGALKELGAGLAVGAVLFTATIGVLALLGAYKVTGVGSAANLVSMLPGAVLAGVFEETLFRGVIFRIIEESAGTWIAMLISAVLFGLIHLINPNATLQGALSIILEAGILLAAAYILTRRLWFPIGLHAAWNFTQGGIFGVQVSGTPAKGLLESTLTGPTWLSGGDFGAEGSVVAIVLCLSVAIAFIVHVRRGHRIIPPFWRRAAALT